MGDLIAYDGNKKKNKIRATVGKVGFTLPAGMGDFTSGEEYKVASVPADSLVLSIDFNVTTAVNGTTPTMDVKLGSTVVHNDIDVSSTGVTSDETRVSIDATTDVTVIPTFTDSTAGAVEVIVTFVERSGYDGAFTE